MTFTKTPPTKPGAYWYRPVDMAGNSGTPFVVECWLRGAAIFAPSYAMPGGEWCGPLVPVEEVEKAYREGWNKGIISHDGYASDYHNSNTRKVVEGTL